MLSNFRQTWQGWMGFSQGIRCVGSAVWSARAGATVVDMQTEKLSCAMFGRLIVGNC